MKTVLLVSKIICLLAAAFAFVALALLLHETQIDLRPVVADLGNSLAAATQELDAARQTTLHVDEGVDYEVKQLEKPPSKAMRIVQGLASVLGSFAHI